MRTLTTALFMALTIALTGSALANEGDHDSDLLTMLAYIDVVPTHAELVATGAGDDGDALRLVALDNTLLQYVRMRAVHMLAHFPSDENFAFVTGLARQQDGNTEVRVAAVYVATTDASPLRVEPIDRLIEDLLVDGDVEVQRAATRAASRLGPERSGRLLWPDNRLRDVSGVVDAESDPERIEN